MKLHISGVRISLGEADTTLKEKIASLLGLTGEGVSDLRIVHRSLDARRERPPYFLCTVACRVPDDTRLPAATGPGIRIEKMPLRETIPGTAVKGRPAARPVVVGSGPAGLFAALTLAENGIPVTLLERGKAVRQRIVDVQSFWAQGILNPESNIHFGEGGAGTFSDGKLTSRARHPRTRWVKEVLVSMGSPETILIDAKPHIGTDRLRAVVVNLRNRLKDLDCEVRFEARMTDLVIHQGRVTGLIVNEREEIKTGHLILAAGQAAEDTYRQLDARGVCLVPKPFAMGLRIEHPQELINRIQYGKWHGHPDLPPAEYFITANMTDIDRSAYTFCMCPGGQVIGCSSEAGGVVTNGMSSFLRNGHFANSAVVVNVRTEDFAGDTPLAGLDFRRIWEKKAFDLAGADYRAPAQRLVDFLHDREGAVGPSSFLPGIVPAVLKDALPAFVAEALKRGLGQFEKKMAGFITAEAMLIGVETRTSSPVRILRKPDGESVNVAGFYPCGEGSGYAGGIVSSALDGIKAAESVMASCG